MAAAWIQALNMMEWWYFNAPQGVEVLCDNL
jgi:hypothetical protein